MGVADVPIIMIPCKCVSFLLLTVTLISVCWASDNMTIQWVRTARDTQDRLSTQKNTSFGEDFDCNISVLVNR